MRPLAQPLARSLSRNPAGSRPGGGGVPAPPSGYAYLVTAAGDYIVTAAGAYVLAQDGA